MTRSVEACASWVIARRDSGLAVCETFEKRTADALKNSTTYEVVPIREWLARVNAQARAAK